MRKDGSIFQGELTSNIFLDSTGKEKTSNIVKDITERTKREEDIKQKNKELAELNSTKDKFFSIIAHDLKSPFSGFLGLTKIMAEEAQDLTLKEMQKFSHSMQTSASNLYKLLENLLEWSRMQRGLTKFNPEILLIASIINQNLSDDREFASIKNIELISNVTNDVEIKADKQMFNTIIRNLLSNAIKFTPKNGKIEIGSCGNIIDDNLICFFVKDNGIGMDDDTINKLFRIDTKVSRLGTEGEPSTGLGLLLCKEFVEKHGGNIWAESEVGKGSTFYFTIPKK